MDTEDFDDGLLSENYKDVLILVRVHADQLTEQVIKAIIRSDIHEVAYRVEGGVYKFTVQNITFMDALN